VPVRITGSPTVLARTRAGCPRYVGGDFDSIMLV